jgi:preprotein translocase subunit SecF
MMNFKKLSLDFLLMFVITFVVSAVVSFLYSLIVHGQGVANWSMAVLFGIIVGIITPWIQRRNKT